jgi:5-methyltetrahydropteroyltriglutamate--homocysteine methyltransferase
MKRSTNRIRTTHTGSMPRPQELFDFLQAHTKGDPYDASAYEEALRRNVADVVRRQVEAGIDVVNDGEYSKANFINYVGERLAGFEVRIPSAGVAVPGPMSLTGRDALLFPDFYKGAMERNPYSGAVRTPPRICVGPVRYIGHDKVKRDIANLKNAMTEAGAEEGFLASAPPIPGMRNEHYKSEEEYSAAFADAMREEYKAILDAGLLLQIDDPRLVNSWDFRNELSVAQYRDWAAKRVEILNHALRGLPSERIRYHTCYGVNFGPRTTDLQLEDVLDLMLGITVGAYSFEAANSRHEHEWRVLQKIKLPDGKVLIPGAVTQSNVMVEHPEVVADRIERWARVAGRENIMAGNDCGFQSTAGNTEIPTTVAWAKLKTLGEGARMASARLWS